MKILKVRVELERDDGTIHHEFMSFERFIAHVSGAISASGNWDEERCIKLTENYSIESKYN